MKNASEYQRMCWIHSKLKIDSFYKEDYLFEFDVSERTFLRDINKLKESFNAPVYYDEIKKKYFYKDSSFELPMMLLNEQEMFGLLLSLKLLDLYKDSPIYLSIYKIFKNLANNLSTDINYFYFEQNKFSKKIRNIDEVLLEKIVKAIHDKSVLEIVYESFSSLKTSKRVIYPLHIYSYEGEFYLAAYCDDNKEIRDFFIGRIKSLDVKNEGFKMDFDISKYFSDKQWGIIKGGKLEKVKFKIKKEKEPWLKEEFDHVLNKYNEDDIWSFYETEVFVNNDFLNWAVGFNEGIIILEPEGVKNKIIEHCRGILENYK
jgi:predicted DNA-binding transcriptional regulator YafY